MAVSIVAAASQSGSTSPLVVSKPPGTANGDVMVAFQSNDYGTYAATTAPAGWTLLTGFDRGTDDYHVKIWTKTASSEGASYSFAHGSSADACVSIVTLNGADANTANWLFAAPTNITTAASSYNAPTVSGAAAGSVMLAHVMTESSPGTTFTWTAPAGMTEQADVQSNPWTTQSVASLLSPSNPTGTKTFTHTGGGGGGGAITASIVIPASGGGGASLTTNPADSVGVTDSLTAVRSATATSADNVAVTDTLNRVADYVRAPVDTVGVTDSLAATRGFDRTPADSVGVTDSAATAQAFARTLADTLGVTDNATFSRTFTFTASDAIGIIDQGSEQTQIIDATYPDTVGIADALAKISAYVRPLADAVGVTDSATFNLVSAGNVSAADNVGIADSLTAAASYVRAPADAAGITDALTVGVGYNRSDAVGVTDSTSFTITVGQVNSADTVGVTEATSFVLYRAAQSFTDALGVTDSATFTILGVEIPPAIARNTVTVSAENRTVVVVADDRSIVVHGTKRTEVLP